MAKFTGKNFVPESIKEEHSVKEETLELVFFCEFREIFKNTILYRTPPMAASEILVILRRLTNKLTR